MLVTYADFSNSNLSNADISKTDFFASNFKNSILNNIKSNPDDNSYIIYSDYEKLRYENSNKSDFNEFNLIFANNKINIYSIK